MRPVETRKRLVRVQLVPQKQRFDSFVNDLLIHLHYWLTFHYLYGMKKIKKSKAQKIKLRLWRLYHIEISDAVTPKAIKKLIKEFDG